MTSSPSGVLIGAQEPRYRPSNRKRSPHADDCAFLATAYKLTPDPWQDLVVNDWLAVDATGKLRHGRCGLAVPRQNGKNAILEMVELYKMVVLGRKILHTAHEVKTARKAFLRLSGFFENERQWPELARMVKEIRRTNGQEAIVLHLTTCPTQHGQDGCSCPRDGGGAIEFIARSRGSGRGFTVDDLVCDEAQELTDEQLEALLPTISSAPSGDPQQIYTGTPPSPGSPGTVFRRMRDAGVARMDPRLAWIEWSVSEVGDIFDRHRVAATNPALGLRLQMSVIDDELGQMTPEGYARERLGWWASAAELAPPVITSSRWRELRATAPKDGTPAYGVRFSTTGERVGIAAGVHWEGITHVEALAVQPAVGATLDNLPLAEWLDPRARAGLVVIDGQYGAGALVEELRRRGVPKARILQPNPSAFITAHTEFLDQVAKSTLTHGDQAGLNAAVAAGGKRTIGQSGGWGWQAIGDGDSLPLEAVTLAAYGARRITGGPLRSTAYQGGFRWR